MLSDSNLNLIRLQFKICSLIKLSPYNVINIEDKTQWNLEVKTGTQFYLTRANMGGVFLSRCLGLLYLFHFAFRNGASSGDKIMMAFLASIVSYSIIIQGFYLWCYQSMFGVINEIVNLSHTGKSVVEFV